jgi:acid stress chaperone HdeB
LSRLDLEFLDPRAVLQELQIGGMSPDDTEGETMKSLFAAALLAGTLLGIGSSSADVIDLSTWKCSQFINADKDTVGIVLAWLDGYYQDEDAPPIIDKERFVGNAKKIGEFCAKNPDVGLITATDKLFGSN